jgi:multiple sugar transport system permease protein
MPGLQQFFGPTNAWGEIMAYASIITLPVLVAFLVFQRRFVQSVVSSGLKG